MIKNPKTKILAEIRAAIRDCIYAYQNDNGTPHFYNSQEIHSTRLMPPVPPGNQPYYCKSDRIIEHRAKKIYDMFDKPYQPVLIQRKKRKDNWWW